MAHKPDMSSLYVPVPWDLDSFVRMIMLFFCIQRLATSTHTGSIQLQLDMSVPFLSTQTTCVILESKKVKSRVLLMPFCIHICIYV